MKLAWYANELSASSRQALTILRDRDRIALWLQRERFSWDAHVVI